MKTSSDQHICFANSVARPCRKRRVKRKVRLNKLSHAHLAGFIVSSPVEPCLTCITQMLLISDFMEREKEGGWGLVACQHFLCRSSTERAKDEEEGKRRFEVWSYCHHDLH